MDNADKNTGAAAVRTRSSADGDDLPSLIRRAGDDLSTLLDTKLSLLKVEVREEISAYARGSMMIMIGGLLAAIGFALLNIAIAFFISTLLANTNLTQAGKYGVGFVITSALYLFIGTMMVLVTRSRLAKQGIIPKRTVAEIEKDKDWLQEKF